jgi:hypothetical protein
MGFIQWAGGIINAFLAPFQAISAGIAGIFDGIKNIFGGIANTIGGVIDGIGNAVGGLFGGTKQSGSAMNTAFAQGIQGNAAAPATAFGESLTGIDAQMPHSDAREGPLSQLTASGRALTNTFAAGMDSSVLGDKTTEVFQTMDFNEQAAVTFQAAMPKAAQSAIVDNQRQAPERTANATPQSIKIENLYLQAEECQILFDFVKMLMQSVCKPEEAAV